MMCEVRGLEVWERMGVIKGRERRGGYEEGWV